jgi:hypothetical protein
MGIIMVREKVRWQKEGKRQEIRVTGGHKSTKVGVCVCCVFVFHVAFLTGTTLLTEPNPTVPRQQT